MRTDKWLAIPILSTAYYHTCGSVRISNWVIKIRTLLFRCLYSFIYTQKIRAFLYIQDSRVIRQQYDHISSHRHFAKMHATVKSQHRTHESHQPAAQCTIDIAELRLGLATRPWSDSSRIIEELQENHLLCIYMSIIMRSRAAVTLCARTWGERKNKSRTWPRFSVARKEENYSASCCVYEKIRGLDRGWGGAE